MKDLQQATVDGSVVIPNKANGLVRANRNKVFISLDFKVGATLVIRYMTSV